MALRLGGQCADNTCDRRRVLDMILAHKLIMAPPAMAGLHRCGQQGVAVPGAAEESNHMGSVPAQITGLPEPLSVLLSHLESIRELLHLRLSLTCAAGACSLLFQFPLN